VRLVLSCFYILFHDLLVRSMFIKSVGIGIKPSTSHIDISCIQYFGKTSLNSTKFSLFLKKCYLNFITYQFRVFIFQKVLISVIR
jgi:hypothetical protein